MHPNKMAHIQTKLLRACNHLQDGIHRFESSKSAFTSCVVCACVCVCARLCFDLADHVESLSKLLGVALNEGNPKSYTLDPTP
jgi:hypothetical protein